MITEATGKASGRCVFGRDDSFRLAVGGSDPGVGAPFGLLLLLLTGDVGVFCFEWGRTAGAFPFQAFGVL